MAARFEQVKAQDCPVVLVKNGDELHADAGLTGGAVGMVIGDLDNGSALVIKSLGLLDLRAFIYRALDAVMDESYRRLTEAEVAISGEQSRPTVPDEVRKTLRAADAYVDVTEDIVGLGQLPAAAKRLDDAQFAYLLDRLDGVVVWAGVALKQLVEQAEERADFGYLNVAVRHLEAFTLAMDSAMDNIDPPSERETLHLG